MSTPPHYDDATIRPDAAGGPRRVADALQLAEAPVVDVGGHLLVADVLAGGIRRFHTDGHELEPLLAKLHRPLGVRVDRDVALANPEGSLSTLDPLQQTAPGSTIC